MAHHAKIEEETTSENAPQEREIENKKPSNMHGCAYDVHDIAAVCARRRMGEMRHVLYFYRPTESEVRTAHAIDFGVLLRALFAACA